MKILCVEDGSVDIDALNEEIEFCRENNFELAKALVYRQGSVAPFLLDDKRDLKDLHLEIIENSTQITTTEKELYYQIKATRLREIFEKRLRSK